MTSELPRVKITDCPVPLPEGIVLPGLPGVSGSHRAAREVRIPRWNEREFMKLWTDNKLKFLKRGFFIRNHNGFWWLQQWLTGRPGAFTLTPRGADILETYLAPIRAREAMELPAAFILPPLPNNLEAGLLAWQPTAARQIFRALMNGRKEWGFACAWDGSDMGIGKTYQSLAAALATGKKVGIICPKSVIPDWHRAFKHFGYTPAFIINYESLRTGQEGLIKRHDRQPGEEAPKMLFEWECDPAEVVLVWDEAHRLKNATTTRKMGLAAFRQDFQQLFLSATMAENPLNLYVTGMAVGLHRGDKGSYEAFLREHGCFKKGQSWYFDKKQAWKLSRIAGLVYPQRGARVRKADLGDLFPQTQILTRAVETEDTAAVKKAYDEAKAALALMNLEGKSAEAIEKAENIAYMKARQLSELSKVGAMADMVAAEIEGGNSAAVFVEFTASREALMKKLGTTCGVYGGQRADERAKCIAAFQADEERVIVLNSEAGGTGVSLHDVRGEFPRTAIICLGNNAVTAGQVMGRVHRANGKSASRQIIIYAAGTIEEDICNNIRRKLANIKSVNDGDLNPDAAF